MKIMKDVASTAFFLAAGALVTSCGTSPDVEAAQAEQELSGLDYSQDAPVVVGTAIEASTGRPLEGALIEGPGGVQTRTDAHGRFVWRGIPAGVEGKIRASTEGGLTAANRLRPLKGGELEVVLHLR